MVFNAIAPPDQSECSAIMSGSFPLTCSLRVFAAVLTDFPLSLLVTSVYIFLFQTSHSRFSSVPLLLSMRYTLCDRADTSPLLPVDLWCKVCPIIPFFLFEIFSVAESVSISVFRDSCLKIIFSFSKIPHLSL